MKFEEVKLVYTSTTILSIVFLLPLSSWFFSPITFWLYILSSHETLECPHPNNKIILKTISRGMESHCVSNTEAGKGASFSNSSSWVWAPPRPRPWEVAEGWPPAWPSRGLCPTVWAFCRTCWQLPFVGVDPGGPFDLGLWCILWALQEGCKRQCCSLSVPEQHCAADGLLSQRWVWGRNQQRQPFGDEGGNRRDLCRTH